MCQIDENKSIMVKLVEMDEKVTISEQMELNVGPVILINKFTVNFVDRFLALRRLIVDYSFIYLVDF